MLSVIVSFLRGMMTFVLGSAPQGQKINAAKDLGETWSWKFPEINHGEAASMLPVEKLRINSLRHIIIVFVLWGILSLDVVPFLNGYLLPRKDSVSAQIDEFTLLPAMMTFFISQYKSTRHLFTELAHNRSILVTEGEYDTFLRWGVGSYNWKSSRS